MFMTALNHQVLDFYSQSSPAATSTNTTATVSGAAKTSDSSKRPATTDGEFVFVLCVSLTTASSSCFYINTE